MKQYDAALRAAATLRARMQKGYPAATITLADEHDEDGRESNVLTAMDFVSRGGELLKRTRKGNGGGTPVLRRSVQAIYCI